MRKRPDWLDTSFPFPEYKLADTSWPDMALNHEDTSWPAMQFNQIWAWPTFVSTTCQPVLGEYKLGGCNPINQPKLNGGATISFDVSPANLKRFTRFSGSAAVAFTVAATDLDERTQLLGSYPLGGEL